MPESPTGSRGDMMQTVIDAAIALALVGSIFVAMFGFTGNWPPLVVVESKSMQHSPTESYIGVMDTGDLVMSKKVSSASDVVTYLEGKRQGHSSYGGYGDVLIYWRGGDHTQTPIIHRAVVYLVANDDGSFGSPDLRNLTAGVDYSFVQPGDSWDHITKDFKILDYGYTHVELDVPISIIISYMHSVGKPLHDGYVTKGDYNVETDQLLGLTPSREPIPVSWIVGKAVGEIPWVGIIKLFLTDSLPSDTPANSITSLEVLIAVVVISSIAGEIFVIIREKRNRKGETGGVPPSTDDKSHSEQK